MPVPTDLKHFAVSEFRHPELVQEVAARMLDEIRDHYGHPLVLTSDARTQAENDAASGSSPTSLHLQGRAFDMKWIPDPVLLWRFVDAVFLVAGGDPVELELVNSATDKHLHFAVLPAGKQSRLLIRAD